MIITIIAIIVFATFISAFIILIRTVNVLAMSVKSVAKYSKKSTLLIADFLLFNHDYLMRPK